MHLKYSIIEDTFGTKLRTRHLTPVLPAECRVSSAGYEIHTTIASAKEKAMTAVGMDYRFEARRAVPAHTHLRLTQRGRSVLMTLAAIPLVIAAALFALN